jgi:hypothetical protein
MRSSLDWARHFCLCDHRLHLRTIDLGRDGPFETLRRESSLYLCDTRLGLGTIHRGRNVAVEIPGRDSVLCLGDRGLESMRVHCRGLELLMQTIWPGRLLVSKVHDAISSSLPRVLTLDDLLIREKRIHRQIGLFSGVRVRLIVSRAVTPPVQLPIVKEDLASVEDLLSFRD